MDQFVPTFLRPRVRFPSTTSSLHIFNLNLNCEKDEDKQIEVGIGPDFKISTTTTYMGKGTCSNVILKIFVQSFHSRDRYSICILTTHLGRYNVDQNAGPPWTLATHTPTSLIQQSAVLFWCQGAKYFSMQTRQLLGENCLRQSWDCPQGNNGREDEFFEFLNIFVFSRFYWRDRFRKNRIFRT